MNNAKRKTLNEALDLLRDVQEKAGLCMTPVQEKAGLCMTPAME